SSNIQQIKFLPRKEEAKVQMARRLLMSLRKLLMYLKSLNPNQLRKILIVKEGKKVTLSADDNIISDDPDAALELAKSTSQTEVEDTKQQGKSMLHQLIPQLIP
nr:hypothetical protein [Tanacetum cinerariifolium]